MNHAFVDEKKLFYISQRRSSGFELPGSIIPFAILEIVPGPFIPFAILEIVPGPFIPFSILEIIPGPVIPFSISD